MVDTKRMLMTAMEAGASDVHLTVGVPPKMRINGRLEPLVAYDTEGNEFQGRLMPPDTQAIADSFMNEKQKEIFESRGEYDMSYSIENLGRYRVNIYKQRGSVAMALRLVGTEVPAPEALGVPASVMNLYNHKRGLVLVTGPTGSGKSTTLASIINLINHNREAHVITLEDPIEYLHRHDKSIVNQREIGLDSMSYANALRAALREDPDVIQVGEMRDFETISVAITAAETGHLVLSTLHTIGAASTVDRVIDVFPPHQQQQIRVQLANVIEAVVSQQLIPTADGRGRVAAFEVLFANPAARNLIREGKTHMLGGIMQTNKNLGMITMDESILQLYKSGQINREMTIQFAQDPDMMSKRV